MASNEIRNPLATISLSSSVLQDFSDTISDKKKDVHFGRIQGAVNRSIEILDEILLLSKTELRGGEVIVYSKVGEGTTFTVIILLSVN